MTARRPYELRNIARIDIPKKKGGGGTKGWQVNLKMNKITKLFSDSIFGGNKAALKEAQLFRDVCERELKYYSSANKNTTSLNKITKRNTSGIPGVSRYIDKRTNRDSEGWEAQWVDQDGKHRRKSFSSNKYGETEAKNLAIEYRNKILQNYFRSKIHPLFEPPSNKSIKIWRYMDFTKFVSILDNGGLFFTRIDKFDDLFEGSFSKGNKRWRDIINSRFEDYRRQNNLDISGNAGEIVRNLRKWVYVSCWHQNDQESAAMWKLYSKTNESVCIQTTYDKLRKLLDNSVEIGKVRYADYQKEWIPESHPLAPFFYKRLSFEHEKEIRAVINLADLSDLSSIGIKKEPIEKGIWKYLNLNQLIERIYIAPNSPNWFAQLVENIVKKYGIEKEIIKSHLENEPFF